jgi:hypothetical protein
MYEQSDKNIIMRISMDTSKKMNRRIRVIVFICLTYVIFDVEDVGG